MFNIWKKKSETSGKADVEIVCLLDRSSSMVRTKHQAIEGFNDFLKEQNDNGCSANFSLILFDLEWKLVYDRIALDKVPELTKYNYQLGRGTSLYDSIALTISHTRENIKTKYTDSQIPKFIIMVLTDGEDSTSIEYDPAVIAEMVRNITDEEGWEFYFLTTSREAYASSETMGFQPTNTHFFKGPNGMTESLSTMSQIIKKQKKDPPTPIDED